MDYLEWGTPREGQPPLLCVHGLARNAADFTALAEALLQEHWIIAPHIVGRGSSDWLADPQHYSYPQYLTDIKALIAHLNVPQVDWLGTSMGGIIGMMLAAEPDNKINRLMINDVGPFIPLAALQRIASYVGAQPTFLSIDDIERYIRSIYGSFGNLTDAQWQFMAEHSTRALPDGRYGLAYDPAIARNLTTVTSDVEFWPVYDLILRPTLVLRGERSDILLRETAHDMTQRGPKAKLITIAGCGHAPALMDKAQIALIRDFVETP